ncbi:MAG: Na+/H+ antiporter NhaA [Nitrospinae bacterium]|nr:Na+/H+ antiporter NhaA [Nitrospinota bacterium]
MESPMSVEKDLRHEAPWERTFDRFLGPIEEFIHYRVNEGLTLAACALLSFVLMNVPALADGFTHLLHAELAVTGAPVAVHMSFHHWVNDGLMTLFFLLMGLEIKREFLVGELSTVKGALTPVVGAVGGMVVPALIFYAINPHGPAAAGWGIPMATDIAFAIGVLSLLGDRIPRTLFVFLVSLAIVDDIGAVLVIAFFYTDQIAVGWLGVGVGVTLLLVALNRAGVRSLLPYGILGGLLWLAALESGVHATIAGVILAFTVPARPRFNPLGFSRLMRDQLDRFDGMTHPGADILANAPQADAAMRLRDTADGALTPLQRLERQLHLPVAFLVIPLFALMNAGISLDADRLAHAATHPVTLGVFFGLVVGKGVGIFGAVAGGVASGALRLPEGVRLSHIFGASLLGGVGFTMSIFVADLAYQGEEELLAFAKIGVLSASLLAGVTGAVWLAKAGR